MTIESRYVPASRELIQDGYVVEELDRVSATLQGLLHGIGQLDREQELEHGTSSAGQVQISTSLSVADEDEGHVLRVRREITEAEFENLNTTPIEIIEAAGSDQVILPIHAAMEVDLASTYGTSPTFSLVHAGSTTNLLNTTWSFNLTATVAKRITTATGVTGAGNLYVYSTFDPRDKAVNLRASANLGAGSATAVLIVHYVVVQVE